MVARLGDIFKDLNQITNSRNDIIISIARKGDDILYETNYDIKITSDYYTNIKRVDKLSFKALKIFIDNPKINVINIDIFDFEKIINQWKFTIYFNDNQIFCKQKYLLNKIKQMFPELSNLTLNYPVDNPNKITIESKLKIK